MTTKHTPTPYTFTKDRTADGDIMLVISSGARVIWQAYDSPVNEANAAFIVHACNNIKRIEKVNAALVEALEELTEVVRSAQRDFDNAGIGDLFDVRAAWQKADKALALAKGE